MIDSPDLPEATPEERELQQLQLDIAQRSERIQGVLLPILLENQGLTGEFDPSGELVGVTEAPSEIRELREEAELGLLRRQQQALAGELPLSDILQKDLEVREEQTREAFRKARPGAGAEFDISEVGRRFLRERSGIIEAASRGDLTLAEQLSASRGLGQEQIAANRFANLSRITDPSLTLSQTIDAPLGRLQSERGLRLQADVAGSQAKSALLGDIFQSIGFIGGSFAGRPA